VVLSPNYWKIFDSAPPRAFCCTKSRTSPSRSPWAHPTFGFDKLRPTVYSGINSHLEPHKQFLFSAAGLTIQSLIDEGILDIPHARGSAFRRGMLGGGIGTTVFYLTIGRTAR
jgi:hypothetical protein